MNEPNSEHKTISHDEIKASRLNSQTLASIEHEHAGEAKVAGSHMSERTIKMIAGAGSFLALVAMVGAAIVFVRVLF